VIVALGLSTMFIFRQNRHGKFGNTTRQAVRPFPVPLPVNATVPALVYMWRPTYICTHVPACRGIVPNGLILIRTVLYIWAQLECPVIILCKITSALSSVRSTIPQARDSFFLHYQLQPT